MQTRPILVLALASGLIGASGAVLNLPLEPKSALEQRVEDGFKFPSGMT